MINRAKLLLANAKSELFKIKVEAGAARASAICSQRFAEDLEQKVMLKNKEVEKLEAQIRALYSVG